MFKVRSDNVRTVSSMHGNRILDVSKRLYNRCCGNVRYCGNVGLIHQSIPAVPIPPPRDNTRALSFFLKESGKFPGVGIHKLSKWPGVRTKEEGKCPAPGTIAYLHRQNFKDKLFYLFLCCFKRFASE